MKHVLVLEDDPDRHRVVHHALTQASIAGERAHSELAAYWRIAALPTLDALIVNVAQPACMEVALFARVVIPKIRIVYLGAHADDATLRPPGLPHGEFVSSPLVGEHLIDALGRDDLACVGRGRLAQGGGRAG